ncbi:MAG: outer membrane protein assembly factor BamB [Gammaproteobacteria bacterium]|nr:outer membrane protein assembly factor BamB [Gammaproteobacteria bacterium]
MLNYPATLPVRRTLIVLAAALMLSGCSSIKNLFSDKDEVKPTPLEDFTPVMAVDRQWSTSLGSGTDKHYLTLHPVVVDGVVYVAERGGKVGAFEQDTGRKLWSHDLKKTTITGGPGVGDGLVLVGTKNGEVVALDAASGNENWRTQLSSEVLAAPQAAQGVIVARSIDGRVIGLDVRSGSRLWIYDRDIPVLTLRGNGNPAIVRDRVLLGFDSGRLIALELQSGREVWSVEVAVATGRTDLQRMVDLDSELMVAGDTVYVASYQGQVAAISITDGSIEWTRDMSSYAGLAVDSRRVYVAATDGGVWALDRLTGASVWRTEALLNRELGAPAAIGGNVVVGDMEGYLHWLNGADGSFVARERLGKDPIFTAPIPLGDHLVAFTSGGRLASFRLN